MQHSYATSFLSDIQTINHTQISTADLQLLPKIYSGTSKFKPEKEEIQQEKQWSPIKPKVTTLLGKSHSLSQIPSKDNKEKSQSYKSIIKDATLEQQRLKSIINFKEKIASQKEEQKFMKDFTMQKNSVVKIINSSLSRLKKVYDNENARSRVEMLKQYNKAQKHIKAQIQFENSTIKKKILERNQSNEDYFKLEQSSTQNQQKDSRFKDSLNSRILLFNTEDNREYNQFGKKNNQYLQKFEQIKDATTQYNSNRNSSLLFNSTKREDLLIRVHDKEKNIRKLAQQDLKMLKQLKNFENEFRTRQVHKDEQLPLQNQFISSIVSQKINTAHLRKKSTISQLESQNHSPKEVKSQRKQPKAVNKVSIIDKSSFVSNEEHKEVLNLNLILSLLTVTLSTTQADDKLAYVFELVRHGARAPLSNDIPPGLFSVVAGGLTQSGMRQRYLLGRLNRQRYIKEYQFLDDTYNPSQIYMQSTDVFRTLQSGYAELMGMYPPGTSDQVLSDGELTSLDSRKGMPAITIRRAKEINKQLGLNAIIDGYVQIPVYNFNEETLKDFDDCPYSDDMNNYNYEKRADIIFADVASYILPIVRKPLARAANWTDERAQNMTFKDAYRICDHLKGYIFEGVPHSYYFTNEQWFYARNIQKWILVLPAQDDGRAIDMTKLISYPLQVMKKRLETILKDGSDIKKDDLKFVINSAHDDQISNMMEWLNPLDYVIDDVPYSSSMYFELHYDTDCLATVKDESCFSVHVTHEGNPLKFDTCVDGNQALGSKSPICSYQGFLAHIDKIKYQGDVYSKCNEPFVPPQP